MGRALFLESQQIKCERILNCKSVETFHYLSQLPGQPTEHLLNSYNHL